MHRVLMGATLSVACAAIKADVPAAWARAIVQQFKHEGVVTEMTGACQLCGATSIVFTAN